MAEITELQLENVRCFAGKQSAKLARITLLVGANSAGKSTFLGCYKALADLANLQDQDGKDLDDVNHFNKLPFTMGSFKTIGRAGSDEFTVGGRFSDYHYGNAAFTFTAGNRDELLERQVCIGLGESGGNEEQVTFTRLPAPDAAHPFGRLQVKGPNFVFDVEGAYISYGQISTWMSRNLRHGILPFYGDLNEYIERNRSTGGDLCGQGKSEFIKFTNFLKNFSLPLFRSPQFIVHALDPEPPFPRQRIYPSNPISFLTDERPEEMRAFGQCLGLWNDIKFHDGLIGGQVVIDTPDGSHNLVDVGYGVYSLLPLASAVLAANRKTTFLLQQPEVHVHPEAQAKLALWMVRSGHNFLIETHSDHFADRFRILVMKGMLSPSDFAIVYFADDGKPSESVIHSITVDGKANVLDAPTGYREFFEAEVSRLLGFGD